MAQRLLVVAHAATPETHALVFGQRGEPLPGEVPQLKGRVASWFSGPEQACQTTVARLGGRAEVIPELRDCDFGEWTGLSLGHVAARSFRARRLVAGPIGRTARRREPC